MSKTIWVSKDYDPETARMMIEYLYRGDYDDNVDREVRERPLLDGGYAPRTARAY